MCDQVVVEHVRRRVTLMEGQEQQLGPLHWQSVKLNAWLWLLLLLLFLAACSYSMCNWGRTQSWTWARSVGNSWRTYQVCPALHAGTA